MRFRLAAVLAMILALALPGAAAAGGGPDRYEIIDQEITRHIWGIGNIAFESCRILTDEIEDVPQYADIAAMCGLATTTLLNDGQVWLYYIGSFTETRQVKQPLPAILINSDYDQAEGVYIWATDPLGRILRIEATLNGIPATCDDSNGHRLAGGGLGCHFPVYTAPTIFSAYAISSYGDQSIKIELRIGNKAAGANNFIDPKSGRLILGDYAYTKYNAYHAIPMRWATIPEDGPPPWWLQQAATADLVSSHSYYYLAGQILLEGRLVAENCANYGLNGQYATICGHSAAFPLVYDYQNAYNGVISAAAARYGVPSRIIKNIIAIESQFWPGALGTAGEKGLYQLTRDGADTLLRWNGAAYLEVCAVYFDYCDEIPYDLLDGWQRDLLANHVLQDHNNAEWLAAALKANAYQVDRLIKNILRAEVAADYFTYAEMWQITIINYHTGATVTAAALQQLLQRGDPINFENYLFAISRVMPSAAEYLARVKLGY